VGVLAMTLAASSLAPAACAQGDGTDHSGEVVGAGDSAALFAGIQQQGITLGDPAAPVELVDLSDLQCPFCRDFARGALPTIVERYVRTGRVRMSFHNLPVLGEQSRRAAHLAVAIGMQDRMFQFVGLFFANQAREGSGYANDDFLRRLAGAVQGCDVERAMRDLDSAVVTERLGEARDLGQKFHLQGVPSFMLRRTGEDLHVLHVRRTSDPAPFVEAIDALLAPR